MNKKALKLDELLSHRSLGRIMEIGEIADEFALIRTAFEAAGKAVPSAEDFAHVGGASGTHLLKLITPRAPTGQHVVRIVAKAANRHPQLYPSPDAKLARVAKVVFRPLEVSGHPARSLAEHILNPDEVSETVMKGFAKAFGDEALEALRRALTEPLPEVETLPAAEFPIIFLPRPGGGDIQATPLAPTEAYVRFGEVAEAYFRKTEEGQPRAPRGCWHRQFVADKPQNISGAVGKQRRRFFAKIPRVLDRWSAELHRYAHGGRFPLWRDDDVVNAVDDDVVVAVFAYADLLDASAKYSNQDIRAGLDRRADALIRAARDFVDETVAEAKAEHPEAELAAPPSIVALILGRPWPMEGYDRARRVLTSDHFKSWLKAAGAH